MRHRLPLPRHALVGVAALLAIALFCGCAAGASSDGVASLESPATGDDASPSPSVDPQEALLAFAQCMREHGIDMPDPQFGSDDRIIATGPGSGGAPDADAEAFAEADEACRHHLEGVALGGARGSPDPEFQEKLLAFAQCMRDHGIDFPDPQFDAGGGGAIRIGGDRGGIDPSSPEFQAAQEACSEHLPGGGPGGPNVAPASPETEQ
jgi:hypothetical protein